MQTYDTHQAALAHVLWIGGGTDAGKTSIAERLATQYDLRLYSFDDRAEVLWENHFSKIPSSYGYALMAKTIDERWVLPSPQTMTEHVIQIALECFPVIVEELLAMPKEPLIIAEGFEFLPECVATVLSTKRQAIWLVPTQAFQEASFLRREKGVHHNDKNDPARAVQNHRTRDWLLAQYVKEQALTRDLEVLEIDGALTVEEATKAVEDHFEPLLRKAKPLNH